MQIILISYALYFKMLYNLSILEVSLVTVNVVVIIDRGREFYGKILGETGNSAAYR